MVIINIFFFCPFFPDTFVVFKMFPLFLSFFCRASSGFDIQFLLVKCKLYIEVFCTTMIICPITNMNRFIVHMFYSDPACCCLELKFPMNHRCIQLRKLMRMLYAFSQFSFSDLQLFALMLSSYFFRTLFLL